MRSSSDTGEQIAVRLDAAGMWIGSASQSRFATPDSSVRRRASSSGEDGYVGPAASLALPIRTHAVAPDIDPRLGEPRDPRMQAIEGRDGGSNSLVVLSAGTVAAAVSRNAFHMLPVRCP